MYKWTCTVQTCVVQGSTVHQKLSSKEVFKYSSCGEKILIIYSLHYSKVLIRKSLQLGLTFHSKELSSRTDSKVKAMYLKVSFLSNDYKGHDLYSSIFLIFESSKLLSFPKWFLISHSKSNENKKIVLKQKAALIQQGGMVFQTKA